MSRLNKALAACGLCSRRAADEFIASGKVKVNGKTVTDFNFQVNLQRDNLSVSGRPVKARSFDYVMLNKPEGIISSCQDELKRKSIIDLLPARLKHLKPVGRLDYDSSGLILLTNDGAFINKITHPKAEIEKTYRIIMAGRISTEAIKELTDGIKLKEAKTKPAKVRLVKATEENSIIEITITEGKNRQLRRMCAQLGLPVLQLIRIGLSKLQLGSLEPGKWRYLTKIELVQLQRNVLSARE